MEPSKQLRVVVPKQELIRVRGRSVSPVGWKQYLAEDHLNWHLAQPQSDKWCPVECMARTMFTRSSPSNRNAVRKRMARLFKSLLERRLLLVIEYDASKDGHGKIMACKIFEANDGQEREYAEHQIQQMKRRRMITQETLDRALALVGVTKETA